MEDIKTSINNLSHAPVINLTPENYNASSKLYTHFVLMNSIPLSNV